MSRLWIEHNTDKRGHGGKNHASCSIYYGSATDSKLAISIFVDWLDGADKPIVEIKKGKGISPRFLTYK